MHFDGLLALNDPFHFLMIRPRLTSHVTTNEKYTSTNNTRATEDDFWDYDSTNLHGPRLVFVVAFCVRLNFELRLEAWREVS